MARPPLLQLRPEGLYCEAGDFFLDPWRPVERAVISHGHSDHARWGHKTYLCASTCAPILRARLGQDLNLQTLEYGEKVQLNGVTLSLHPAGHLLGSAQIRVEHGGEVWVFTGDYKLEHDATAEPFERVRCHTFITETTFGLPIYRWQPQQIVMEQINAWWQENAAAGRPSLLMAYALGKAQRLLAGVEASIGPIVAHGAVRSMNACYAASGIRLPVTCTPIECEDPSRALVIAPPSVLGTPWLKRFPDFSSAFASGWMAVRGRRRQRGVDRGFVLSDHVDWPGLLQAVRDTGAERVLTTHGYADTAARYFRENGWDASDLHTPFEGADALNQEDEL